MDTSAFLAFLSRRRILILLFLLAWLVLLDLLWLIPTRQGVYSSASELSMQVAENASSNVSTYLESVLARVQNAALDIEAEPERAQITIERLLRRNPSFVNAVIVSRDGTQSLRMGQFEGADNERDYSKMPGVYLALAGSPSFGDVMRDDQNGQPTSMVTVPITRADGTHAVLVVDVNLEHVTEIVVVPRSGTWRTYVTNQKGLEIIGPNVSTAESERNFLARPIVQKVAVDGQFANGLALDDAYVNDQGVRAFAVGIPIPIANWGLFVERPETEAFRGVSVVTRLAVAIIALGLLAILVALWSYWRLTTLNERLGIQGRDLLQMNTQLKELDRIKTEFISVAAHQLRTPLSSLKWTLGLLIDEHTENLSVEQKSLLMKGFESNERIIKLINEMLVVTRIESGKIKLTFTPIHIEDLIESVVLDFAGQAHVRKIALSFDRPKERLPFISADSEQVRNVIQNLIENSVRYTPEGGSIRLSASAEGHMIKMTVADTGIGIPAKQQSSIFNKFFRADNATRHRADGSGQIGR